MLHGPDADLPAKLVGIALQEWSQDVGEDSIALGLILRDPGPHRGERVGKGVRIPASLLELARQQRSRRRRTRPASCCRPRRASRRPPSQLEPARLSIPSSRSTPGCGAGAPARVRCRTVRGSSAHPRGTVLPGAAPATRRPPRQTASSAPRRRRRGLRSPAAMSPAPRQRRGGRRRGCRWRRALWPREPGLAGRQAPPSWPVSSRRSARSCSRAPSARRATAPGR